jgi:hypothetical protein
MNEIEDRLKLGDVQQFELFLDIVLAPPGRLEGETIPETRWSNPKALRSSCSASSREPG